MIKIISFVQLLMLMLHTSLASLDDQSTTQDTSELTLFLMIFYICTLVTQSLISYTSSFYILGFICIIIHLLCIDGYCRNT